MLQRQGALVNMIGDESTLALATPHIDAFLDSLPVVSGVPASWTQMLARQNEALVVPTQVCAWLLRPPPYSPIMNIIG